MEGSILVNALVTQDSIAEEIRSLRRRISELETEAGEQLRLGRELNDSEKKYRTIFENTGTATVLIEEDMTISMANEDFTRLSGYRREEIEGRRRFTEFILEEDLTRMKAYHFRRRVHRSLAPRNYECRFVNRYDAVRHCYMTVAVLPETGQSLASFMDITERREAERALNRSEEKFSKIFRLSPGVIITTPGTGRCVDVNETFLSMTGFTREEMVGCPVEAMDLWADTRYHRNLIRDLEMGVAIHNQEVEYRTKKGELRYGLLSADISYLETRPIIACALVDITAQRRLEDEILRISESERQRAGLDLHDDLGQHLIGIEALNMLLEKRLEQNHRPEAAAAKEIAVLLKEAIEKTRNLRRGLCPVNMEEGGLQLALRELAQQVESRFKIACTLSCVGDFRVKDNRTATHLYHIVREFVNNGARGASATNIRIRLVALDGILTLVIDDDSEKPKEGGSGRQRLYLKIMAYRAKRIGAVLDVTESDGAGARLVCTL